MTTQSYAFGKQETTVPAGTFDTLRVIADGDDLTTTFELDQLLGPVKLTGLGEMISYQ
ncbi:MAG: hypothetical protein HN348_28970 [Proteobacteria bacterium]|nr:hypothetical protein [Pseudomonadota bacterium]